MRDHPDIERIETWGYPRPESAPMEGIATVWLQVSFEVEPEHNCLTMDDVEAKARELLEPRLKGFELNEVETEDFDPHS